MIFKKFIVFLILTVVYGSCTHPDDKYGKWENYGGTKETIRYSSLKQIDTTNIQQLQVAWIYKTEDIDSMAGTQIQCNPIVIDGVLYGTSPRLKLFALDAATGEMQWTFNPKDSTRPTKQMINVPSTNRGLSYWTDGKEDKRLFYAVGYELIAVNAGTGKIVEAFGNNGRVDLHEGLGWRHTDFPITMNTPGMIYNDLIIIGSIVSEGTDAGPGHIRAYDVRTGEQKWIFHTIPHPGEFGYDTWDDPLAYQFIGGANNWSGMSLDEKRGIVYVPTGSASYDFYGGRRTGENLFANSIIALDAATGMRIWHFQTVHHDVWDRDLPTPPALVTINRNGEKIDAVAQPTKSGMLFVFDRVTGEPVYPIEEVSVPTQTDIAGEKINPTQPVTTFIKPFARQSLTENDLNDLVPDSSYQDIKQRLASYRTGAMFNPPSRQGTVIFPGYDGGAEWGGPSFDPATGMIYINSNEMPWVLTMVEIPLTSGKNENYLDAGKRLYMQNCMSCHGKDREGSDNFPSLKNIRAKHNDATVTSLLSSGKGRMPAFNYLSPQEKEAIKIYLLEKKSDYNKNFEAAKTGHDHYLQLPYATTGYNKFLTKEGYPAVKPPWGTLNAINLNTGNIEWKVPLGDHPDFAPKGIKTGTENYGGPVTTAGGLLFIAGTPDKKIRAFNKRNGEVLWEYQLPSAGFATPAVYAVNGKQYIVIACGGGKLGTRSGSSYVAFALPDNVIEQYPERRR